MRKIFLLLVVAVVLLSTKAFAEENFLEVYTFKKDRVDQEIKGNRGYLSGEAPEINEKNRKTQRTLIGVDIQVGISNDDDEDVSEAVKEKKETESFFGGKTEKTVELSKPSVKKTVQVSEVSEKAPVKNKVLIVEETETDWIK